MTCLPSTTCFENLTPFAGAPISFLASCRMIAPKCFKVFSVARSARLVCLPLIFWISLIRAFSRVLILIFRTPW